jgi:hypothetical protein
MKTVLSYHREVCHIWAAQSQPEGRASNMHFEGQKLFSYSTVIAQLCPDRDGALHAVFDRASFSVSTSKQQGYAMQAANHYPRTFLERGKRGQMDLTPNRSDCEALIAKAQDYVSKRATVYKRAENLRGALSCIERAQALAHTFKIGRIAVPKELRLAVELPNIREAEELAAKATAAANTPEEIARKEADRAKRAALKAKRLAQSEAEAVADWKAGARIHRNFSRVYLRLINEDEKPTVETSHGARVRLSDALSLFRRCQIVKRSATPYAATYDAPRFQVGPYQLNEIDKDGNARVGCHSLTFAEMEALFLTLSPSQISEATATPSPSLS